MVDFEIDVDAFLAQIKRQENALMPFRDNLTLPDSWALVLSPHFSG